MIELLSIYKKKEVGIFKKHFNITKCSMAKNFSSVYHECQNRLSLELDYDGIAPRLRVVSKECLNTKALPKR